MPQLAFASQSYGRPEYGLPEARLVNMLVEPAPKPQLAPRIPRPGLVQFLDLDPAYVRGMFQSPGVFGGDVFTVAGQTLYRGSTGVATYFTGIGSARFSGSYDQLATVCDGMLFIYDGTTLAHIDKFKDGVTDLPAFSDVFNVGDRFYYLERGNDTIWYADLSNGKLVDGLAFFTAESSPDANIGAAVLGDEAYIFGAASVEPWYQTGNQDAPLQRSQGRRFEKGCAAQESIAKLDNALFWVGNDRIVYRTGTVPKRVSQFGVEERLRKCTDIGSLSAWSTYVDGHALYILNIPGQTSFAYDVATGEWAEWTSYGRTTFRGSCGVMVDGLSFVGDDTVGKIWVLTPGVFKDGTDPITRIVSGGLLLQGGVARCNNVTLECVRGQGTGVPGQGFNPVVQLRWSDDGGRTWSDWASASLGRQGEYAKKATWWRLGLMPPPGRAFEWRCTDPVNFVASGATLNEPRP